MWIIFENHEKSIKKNKLILKPQQRFRNEKKLFPEQVNRLH